jgi:hypothetical protein
VVTGLGVPTAAILEFNSQTKVWRDLDAMTVSQCVNEEWDGSAHPDSLRCAHARGADKTYFQHEGISPARYWLGSLGIFFLFDCFITALLVAGFYVARWVIRGFRNE